MKKLRKFKTEEEEAHFWDTYSPLDYPSEFTEVKEPFEFAPGLIRKAAIRREERKRQLTLRMGQRQIDLAKVIAKYKGLGYQTLIRIWVIEGIRREFAVHPEVRKLLVAKLETAQKAVHKPITGKRLTKEVYV